MTAAPGERVAAGWVPEPDTFGERLALVSKKMGWHTADQASREYGFKSKEAYRTWLKGVTIPRNMIETCLRISHVTGVDFGWLYGGPAMTGMTPAEVMALDANSLNAPYLVVDDRRRHQHHADVSDIRNGHPVDHGRPAGRPQSSTRPTDGRPARLPRRARTEP